MLVRRELDEGVGSREVVTRTWVRKPREEGDQSRSIQLDWLTSIFALFSPVVMVFHLVGNF